MRKKIASIAMAGAVAMGIAGTAPAVANAQTSQQSAQSFIDDPAAAIESMVGSAIWTPFILSTMGSSLFGEQCNLFDTRGCHET